MEKVYLITYDLNSPGQRYDEIITTIKETLSTGVWCTFWKSSFVLKSSYTPQQMIELLEPNIDGSDRFLIIEVTNNYSGWLSDDEWEYLRENVF